MAHRELEFIRAAQSRRVGHVCVQNHRVLVGIKQVNRLVDVKRRGLDRAWVASLFVQELKLLRGLPLHHPRSFVWGRRVVGRHI